MSRPINYKQINVSYPFKCRSTYQQTDLGLIHKNPIFNVTTSPDNITGATATSKIRQEGMTLGYVTLANRAVAANLAGLGVRIPNARWEAGTWVNATTTYTKQPNFQTTTAQNLGASATNNGIAIFCNVPFNLLSMNVTTADVTGTVGRTFSYTLASGALVGDVPTAAAWSADVALTAITIGETSATMLPIGEALYVWDPPADWGVIPAAGNPSWAVNAPGGMYGVRLRMSTAPTTVAIVSGMEIGLVGVVAPPLTILNTTGPAFFTATLPSGPIQFMYGDALIAFFSVQLGGTTGTSFGNSVDATLRVGVS